MKSDYSRLKPTSHYAVNDSVSDRSKIQSRKKWLTCPSTDCGNDSVVFDAVKTARFYHSHSSNRWHLANLGLIADNVIHWGFFSRRLFLCLINSVSFNAFNDKPCQTSTIASPNDIMISVEKIIMYRPIAYKRCKTYESNTNCLGLNCRKDVKSTQ